MDSRERVRESVAFRAPDVVPLRVYPGGAGLYEHGQKLLDLVHACGHDFGDASLLTLPPGPAPEDFDADGRYHAFQRDEWGTLWEFRIYGVWGHPVEWPLEDYASLPGYRAPVVPELTDAEREAGRACRSPFYQLGFGGLLFERMHSIRRFEDVLTDLGLDCAEVNSLADLIVDHQRRLISRSLGLGVDGVAFGDDFGTQTAMLMSPETWRRFFKPRYRELFAPIRAAGRHVFFHCCGRVPEILPDLAEIGVDVIWPQLTAYDTAELARICRDVGLAIEVHPDRGEMMQKRDPDRVRDYVLGLVERFDLVHGGGWLYLEVDPGFDFANVEALFEVAMELRRG